MKTAVQAARRHLRPRSISVPLSCRQRPICVSPAAFRHSLPPQRWLSSQPPPSEAHDPPPARLRPDHLAKLEKLPVYCPGCGAPSQVVSSEDAGFYTLTRQGLKEWLRSEHTSLADDEGDIAPNDAEESVLCDRCHHLLHHSRGSPIFHPSIQSIHDIIDESPSKINYIYHVLDAADLPMSLIPSLQRDLNLPRLRTQNRRSKHQNFVGGRLAEVNFIITRADLLAPQKEQVDRLMPYFRDLLREALGHTGKNVRLGNVRCVSAKQDWWTREVKEEIYQRGGVGWMVGKVNVGKSTLFEKVFPKGRARGVPMRPDSSTRLATASPPSDSLNSATDAFGVIADDEPTPQAPTSERDDMGEYSLLPPARQEFKYPAMPIASALPGTTASPIRIPFGNGKGELIDLPGVARSRLDEHVQPAHHQDLVMRTRPKPTRLTITPGQSLLLGGGLIRITPRTDHVVLAHPFVPLSAHVTATTKAEDRERGLRTANIPSIVSDAALSRLRSAGHMPLRWDRTRALAGPLTRSTAQGLPPDRLPFVVWSADVVVEGVGWVELSAQTRRPRAGPERGAAGEDPFQDAGVRPGGGGDADAPAVEVFSPDGAHVTLRRPMGASTWSDKPKAGAVGVSRPRRSMRSVRGSDGGRSGMAAAGGGE